MMKKYTVEETNIILRVFQALVSTCTNNVVFYPGQEGVYYIAEGDKVFGGFSVLEAMECYVLREGKELMVGGDYMKFVGNK